MNDSIEHNENRCKTGFVFDPLYIRHVLDPWHPESPARLEAIKSKMDETGLIHSVTPVRPLTDPFPHISSVHTPEHIDSVHTCPTTGEVAPAAVSGALGAVDSVCKGMLTNAFCAIRPPGHHAVNNTAHCDGMCQGQGFCFFNNITIAARYAQEVHKKEKILIVDWDYHHGNGTEEFFYDDPSVLFFSTHNYYAYPGTGNPQKRGTGEGHGYTINVNLPDGATDSDILTAFDNQLVPAADSFKPDLILISAGFDSRTEDTLGTFDITDNAFSRCTRIVMDIAERCCDGRIVSFLEGGYNVEGLAKAVAAHIETLMSGEVTGEG
jgi:acetoin utilization deacetylase AcuC-like enzyme